MVANKVFLDPRGVDCVFCYTDTEIPLDSIITINDTPAYVSKVFTSAEGWNPGIGNSNQGVIGFNYTGTGYTYGDTFVIVNSTGSVPISGYAPGPSYGYLNFASESTGLFPGNYLCKGGDYFNVGAGDFTLEFYFKLTNFTTGTFIHFTDSLDYSVSNKFWILFYGDNMQYSLAGSPTSFNLVPTLNEWHHFALSRASGTFYPYLDGQQGAVFSETTNFVQMLSCFIGGLNLFGTFGIDEVYCLNGSMSNVRVTENVALYTTSSFTPPTPPLSYDANTTILLMPVSEGTKYVNSVDNESFINHDNPVTNQAVTFSAGPIIYPTPPPVYLLYFTPTENTFDWYEGPNFTGTPHYSETLLGFINADVNSVQTLSLYTNITTLSGLNFYPNLQTLEIVDTDLQDINFLGCTALNTLRVELTPLTALNVYNSTNLTGLTGKSCNLQYLTLPSSAPNLKYINIFYNSVNELNVSSYTNLEDLTCYYNSISSLTLGTLPNLSRLLCGSNQFSTIDISGLSALTRLECAGNQGYTQLTSIDISNNSNLQYIDVSQNLIPSIDFSNCNSVTDINVGSNYISSLNLSGKTTLVTLNCFQPSLTSLNITNCTELVTLDCHFTGLSSLDLSTNSKLTYLTAWNNANFSTSAVDQILITLAANAVASSLYYGLADLSSCAPRSSASDAAVSTLIGAPYYWSVYTS